MKKIILLLAFVGMGVAAHSQTLNPFPTTDSLRKFINKWIRNSPIDAFTNLRLNTALIGMSRFIDSAEGGGGIGSVTNVATGYGLLGGPITSTGTIRADSATLSGYYLRRKDSLLYSTTRGVRDSMYRALNSMPMTSKIEFIQSGNSTTYQSDDLIGKYVLLVSGEGYIYGTLTRTTGYYSFNAGTGTITIHNSQLSNEDYVLILYRTTPIYLTDGSGNYVVDGNGNYIIAN